MRPAPPQRRRPPLPHSRMDALSGGGSLFRPPAPSPAPRRAAPYPPLYCRAVWLPTVPPFASLLSLKRPVMAFASPATASPCHSPNHPPQAPRRRQAHIKEDPLASRRRRPSPSPLPLPLPPFSRRRARGASTRPTPRQRHKCNWRARCTTRPRKTGGPPHREATERPRSDRRLTRVPEPRLQGRVAGPNNPQPTRPGAWPFSICVGAICGGRG